MILVHVEHFLNAEGQEYFPRWLDEVREVLKGFQGFKSLCQLSHVDAPEECHLLLKFEELGLLRSWASSDAHDGLLEKLAPYREQTQRSTIFEEGEEAAKSDE